MSQPPRDLDIPNHSHLRQKPKEYIFIIEGGAYHLWTAKRPGGEHVRRIVQNVLIQYLLNMDRKMCCRVNLRFLNLSFSCPMVTRPVSNKLGGPHVKGSPLPQDGH